MIPIDYDDGLSAFDQCNHSETLNQTNPSTYDPDISEAPLRPHNTDTTNATMDTMETMDTTGNNNSELQRYYKEFMKFTGQCNGVIISHTGESTLQYEHQIIRALLKKNPEMRIFNVDGWKSNNPGQDVHKAILEYVDRGPEFIIVHMNKKW